MARPKGSKDKQKRKQRTDEVVRNIVEKSPITAIKRLNRDGKKEDLQRIIGETLQYRGRPPVMTNDEVAERLDRYFAECYENGQIPTVEDMCLALGVTRMTVHSWEHGIKCDAERAHMIQIAKECLAAIDAKLVTENKLTPVTYIFRAKNYFGMKDQREDVQIRINPLGETVDKETLAKKYLENTYGISDNKPELPEPKPIIIDGQNSD